MAGYYLLQVGVVCLMPDFLTADLLKPQVHYFTPASLYFVELPESFFKLHQQSSIKNLK
jgi:hypothetical protein